MSAVTVSLIIIGVFIIVFELKRKKWYPFDTMTLFNIVFIISYIITPIVILNNNTYMTDIFKFAGEIFNKSVSVRIITVICIGVFYLSALIGYNLKKYANRTHLVIYTNINKSKLLTILMAITVIGFLVFFIGYGGASNVLSNINTIRSGAYERNTIAAIAKIFTKYIQFAFLICYARYLNAKGAKGKKHKATLIVTMLLCIFDSVTSGGRGNLIRPFALAFLLATVYNRKINFKSLFFLLLFGSFFLIFGKMIYVDLFNTDYIATMMNTYMKDLNDGFFKLIQEFTHPFYSLVVSINVTEEASKLMYFRNPLYTILFFLHAFGFPYQGTIAHYNTLYILGEFDSTIPPAIVGTGYYNFYIVGVILIGFLYGYILAFTDTVFHSLLKQRKSYEFNISVYVYFMYNLAFFTANGDIRVFLFGNASIIILCLFIYIFVIRMRTGRLLHMLRR